MASPSRIPSRPDDTRRLGLLPVILTAVAGLLATFMVVHMTQRIAHLEHEVAFKELASRQSRAFQATVDLHVNELEATRAFFDASVEVERDEFSVFVAPILARRNGIRAVERVKRVRRSERRAYESDIREEFAEAHGEFVIREVGPDGAVTPAGDRDEYYPVYFMEPYATNERAFGLDMASDDTRRAALVAAAMTNAASATEPVDLVQDSGKEFVLVFVPTYDVPSESRHEREANLTGFILGVFDIPGILAEAMAYFETDLVTLDVLDGEKVLASSAEGSELATEDGLVVEEGVSIGDRSWTIRCAATPKFLSGRATLLPVLTGTIGGVVTLLIAGYVLLLVRRSQYEQQLAAEERRHQDRQRLILRELDHRVKNNLATVLSLAERTAEVSDSLDHFRESFTGRIRSMAHTHQALAAERWEGVQMSEVARLVLGPYGRERSERISIQGDPLLLSPEWSSGLCMTLHELATNAAKYGALSVATGRVNLRWREADGELIIDWQERGGPPASVPSEKGFGTRLITGVIEYELGGRVEIEYSPAGLTCHIAIPFEQETVGAADGDGTGKEAEVDS